MIFKETLSRLIECRHLEPEEAGGIMNAIVNGEATGAQIGAVLIALRMKGERPNELAAFARVMRAHAVTVTSDVPGILVDTCGTGGDGTQTFNISTASAFVAAGAGIPVVKHGNSGVSSRCGSADVLSALGVTFIPDPKAQAKILKETGIAFLFAPHHHPAMRHVMAVRQDIGCRTVFNLLGPLSNPAGARAQVLGVYSQALTGTIAEALRQLGLLRAMVVHGSGLDEITITGETTVAELGSGKIHGYRISPEQFGISRARLEDLSGGDTITNARIIREILAGEHGARRDIVLMNAGAAIYTGGKARDLHEGITLAAEAIDSGRAMSSLNALIAATGGAA